MHPPAHTTIATITPTSSPTIPLEHQEGVKLFGQRGAGHPQTGAAARHGAPSS